MQFQVFELRSNRGYTFLVGTDSPPTSRLREQVSEIFAGVWGELFAGKKHVPDYGFELLQDKSTPTGESQIPELQGGKTYLIFVLLESESGSAVGEFETVKGIVNAIRKSQERSRSKSEIGLITLYNCSVQVLESRIVEKASSKPSFVNTDPFDDLTSGSYERKGRWDPWER